MALSWFNSRAEDLIMDDWMLKWYSENREKHIKELLEAAEEVKYKTQTLKDAIKLFKRGENIINGRSQT